MAILTLSSFTHHGMAGCAYNIITLSSPSALPSSSLDISMTGKVWKMSNQLSVTICFVFLSIPVVLVLQTFTEMRLSSSFQMSRNFDKFIDTKSGYKDEKVKYNNIWKLNSTHLKIYSLSLISLDKIEIIKKKRKSLDIFYYVVKAKLL